MNNGPTMMTSAPCHTLTHIYAFVPYFPIAGANSINFHIDHQLAFDTSMCRILSLHIYPIAYYH